METTTIRRMNTISLGKDRLFYHLPPTAIPVDFTDLISAIRALRDPEGSLERFTSAVVNQMGNPNCFLTASGRSALLVILLSIKQHANRTKVILPAYTCPTVAQAVLQAGLQPVFCDVSPDTLALDRLFLAKLVDDQTLAIIPTHLYGLVQEVSDLITSGHEMGIYIIEDAAQAFGAQIHGIPAGNAGDFGFFSMGRGKCIPTGHGGMILARDRFVPVLEQVLRETMPDRTRLDISAIASYLGYSLATTPAGWWFIVRSPLNPAQSGMNPNHLPPIELRHLSPVQAGIGISILKRLDRINSLRCQNAHLLMDLIANYQFITLPKIPAGSQPVFLRLPVIVKDKVCSDRLFQLLSKLGIGVSRSYTRSLPDIFSNRNSATPSSFPGAQHLADCLLTLPTHHLDEANLACFKAVFDSMDPSSGD